MLHFRYPLSTEKSLMIDIRVQDETPSNKELADRIFDIATMAKPVVEDVTGLPLDTVTIELVDVEGLAAAASASCWRLCMRDTKNLNLSNRQHRAIASFPRGVHIATRRVRLHEQLTLIANSIGQPSTLIAPEVLQHLGLLNAPELLCEELVRALAKQAQVLACKGILLPPAVWPLTRPSKHAVQLFSDGHACWTSDQATPRILGKPAPRRRQRLLTRLLGGPAAIGGRQVILATTFVEQAMSLADLDTFNKVWTVPGLAPTLSELSHADEWIKRLLG